MIPLTSNPIEGIHNEVEKAKRAPKKVGLLSIKPANDWIEDSMNTPDPKTYFHGLIVEYETTVIFASSNVGKSILAVQIAETISHYEKVLYVDLELSGKQFQLRYTDPVEGRIHIFPGNFIRAEIAPELIVGADLETEILDSIETAARQGIKFFVIDNITFICNDSEKGSTAGTFMMKLIRLKKTYQLTTIVVAHTPKRRPFDPITQNDLAGSAKLINFFDAGIALARSAKDSTLRYLKQVKVRTGEMQYGGDNVIVFDITKENGFLKFDIQGYANEYDHLKTKGEGSSYDEIIDILKLQRDGKTTRETAEILGISAATVCRRLKTAKENNITIPAEDELVSDVSPVSHTKQVKRMKQDTAKLPLKD